MSRLMREEGSIGKHIQVFVPNQRIVSTNTVTVQHGNVVRFSVAGQYEFNDDGLRIPFPGGMVMGIPDKVTEIKLYDPAGSTLTAQAVEIM